MRAYFAVLLLGVALLLGAGGLNLLVDPYLLYDAPRIDGFNGWKTRFFYGQYQAKPRLAAARPIRHLVLGTSTAGGSLRPDHPGFHGEVAFNYALAGSTPRLQLLALAQVARSGNIGSVIVCVDFFAYNAWLEQRAYRDFEAAMEPGEGPGPSWRRGRRTLETLLGKAFNYDAVADAARTVAEQRKPGVGGQFRDLRADGFWQNPRPPEMPQLGLFTMVERRYLATGWFPEPARRYALDDGRGRSTLAELDELLGRARDAGAQVTIAIMPFHARLAEALHEAGLWDEFDELKRQLVALGRQARYGGAVRVWDFSGYTGISMDPVKGSPRDTPWFEDSIHPSVATGDLMLDRMLEDAPAGGPDADFGVLLESATLEAQLATAVARRAEYQAANPADVEQIRLFAQQTAPARRPAPLLP